MAAVGGAQLPALQVRLGAVWLIVASAVGAARNPAWYYNLAARPPGDNWPPSQPRRPLIAALEQLVPPGHHRPGRTAHDTQQPVALLAAEGPHATRSATLAPPTTRCRGESPPGCHQPFRPNKANVADAALVHKPDVRALARCGPLRGWRSTRPSTANSAGQGAIDPQQERPTAPGRHGWRINKASRWREWADPDVGMALSAEEELEGVRDGRDFRNRRRDLDSGG